MWRFSGTLSVDETRNYDISYCKKLAVSKNKRNLQKGRTTVYTFYVQYGSFGFVTFIPVHPMHTAICCIVIGRACIHTVPSLTGNGRVVSHGPRRVARALDDGRRLVRALRPLSSPARARTFRVTPDEHSTPPRARHTRVDHRRQRRQSVVRGTATVSRPHTTRPRRDENPIAAICRHDRLRGVRRGRTVVDVVDDNGRGGGYAPAERP